MNDKSYNVIFLCTGNSARSILAEALLNQRNLRRFRGFSAGSHPTGRINPFARELLEGKKLSTDNLRSKSWDEFARAGAPTFDFIFTVCDNAAGEACPIWLGHPLTAHWGIPDPAAVQGTDAEKRTAFMAAFRTLERRIDLLVNLSIESLDKSSLLQKLEDIGTA